MKRFTVILLLFVFLMYQAGFYLFYLSLNHYKEESWRDNSYGQALQNQYIEKSIPITLAYQHDQTEFQPVMQSIEIDGKYYRVIKQRYAKDTLHILYVADMQRQTLHQSLKDWVSTLSQQSSQDKKAAPHEGLEKNYLPCSLALEIYNQYIINPVYSYSFVPDLLFNPADVLKPPPRFS